MTMSRGIPVIIGVLPVFAALAAQHVARSRVFSSTSRKRR